MLILLVFWSDERCGPLASCRLLLVDLHCDEAFPQHYLIIIICVMTCCLQVEAFLIFEVETLILTSQMTKDTGFYGSPKGLQFLEGEPNLRQNFMIFCTGTCKDYLTIYFSFAFRHFQRRRVQLLQMTKCTCQQLENISYIQQKHAMYGLQFVHLQLLHCIC